MRGRGGIHIGCSGWQYQHWRGDFYPAGLPPSRWFAHYALHFDTVEINNSFYRLPEAATLEKWREQAPRCPVNVECNSGWQLRIVDPWPSTVRSRWRPRSTSSARHSSRSRRMPTRWSRR